MGKFHFLASEAQSKKKGAKINLFKYKKIIP